MRARSKLMEEANWRLAFLSVVTYWILFLVFSAALSGMTTYLLNRTYQLGIGEEWMRAWISWAPLFVPIAISGSVSVLAIRRARNRPVSFLLFVLLASVGGIPVYISMEPGPALGLLGILFLAVSMPLAALCWIDTGR